MGFIRKAQKPKKISPRLIRRLKERGRRVCAILICAAMVMSGLPPAAFSAFAADDAEEYHYEFDGEYVYDSLLAAVSEGTALEKELIFTGEYAQQYDDLFEADGTLYELKDLKPDRERARDKVLDLRVFVRLVGDIPLDGEYVIDGSEPFIFLLSNRSKETAAAVISVDDLKTDAIELIPASSVPKSEGPGSAGSGSGGNAGTAGSGSTGTGSSGSTGITNAVGENAEAEDDDTTLGDHGINDAEGLPETDTEDGPEQGSEYASEAGSENGEDETEAESADDGSEEAGSPEDESAEGGSAEKGSTEEDSAESKDKDEDSAESKDKDDGSAESDDTDDKAADAGSAAGKTPEDESSGREISSVSARREVLLAASLNETRVIASASDAEASDDEADSTDDEDVPGEDTHADHIIDGELYPAVLLDGKRTAVAFVTTAEELGLDRFADLEEQTIEAEIYTDASCDKKLADGTDITLTGMMPAGAVAKAYPVDVEIDGVHVLAAYDITIFTKNGREFQPEDDVIEVSIENDAIYEALEEERELTVYHMEDETDEPEEIAVIQPAPRRLLRLGFSAEKFSIYIVGEDDTYTDMDGNKVDVYTVNFYEYVFDDHSQDQTEPISTQRLVGEDYLLEPYVPEIEHHVFDGWYTEEQDRNRWDDHESLPGFKYDFDMSVAQNLAEWGIDYAIGDNNVISLYSDYDPVYYVYYMTRETDAAGNPVDTHNFYTDEYHENDSILNTSAAESLYLKSHLSAGEAVTNWYYRDNEGIHYIDDAGQLNGSGEFEIKDDITLYPVVEEVIWVYFEMGDEADDNAEFPAPIYLPADAATFGELPYPAISGYSFAGWWHGCSKTQDGVHTGGEEAQEGGSIEGLVDEGTHSITLHAHWEPDYVGYTVNIWRQKATDGQLGLDQKKVTTGETYGTYITYYDYAENFTIDKDESRLKTGQVPETGIISGYTGYGGIVYDSSDPYNCFEYNRERTENDLAAKEMAADGSTVINVFYDRVTVTWTFQSKEGSGAAVEGDLTGLYGTNVIPANGSEPAGTLTEWKNPSVDKSLWAYRIKSSNELISVGFETSYVLKRGAEPPNEVTFFPQSAGNLGARNCFYLEMTNEEAAEANTAKQEEAAKAGVSYIQEVNGKKYVFEREQWHYWTSSSSSGTRTVYLDNKFMGYEVSGYGKTATEFVPCTVDQDVSVGNNGTVYVYNDALEYKIDLQSSNGERFIDVEPADVSDPEDIVLIHKYRSDLTGFELPRALDPDKFAPADYYYFPGIWYSDPTFTAEFAVPDTMPSSNLVAYTRWELKNITVIFESDVESDLYDILQNLYPGEVEVVSEGGGGDGGRWAYSITIPAGSQLNKSLESGLTQKQSGSGENEHHYDFAGWLNMNDNDLFSFDSHIYTDTTIRAFWTEDETIYRIRYHINTDADGYEGETVVLGTAHDISSYARVKELIEAFEEASGLESEFICWNTEEGGTGRDYFPDDEIIFSEVTTVPLYDDQTGDLLCYVYDLYAKWIKTKETSLILDYNYPGNGAYDPSEDDNPTDNTVIDKEIYGEYGEEESLEDLGPVKLSKYSELTKTTIRVNGRTYVFVGWSYRDDAKTADITPDGTVAVDELGLEAGSDEKNTLYAVWITTGFPADLYKYDPETYKPLGQAEFILSKKTVDPNSGYENISYAVFTEQKTEGDYGETVETVYIFEKWSQDKGDATVLVSGEDGYIHLEDLEPDDDYYLTEIRAPDGYTLLSDDIALTVEPDGSIRYTTDNGEKTSEPSAVSPNNPGEKPPVAEIENTAGAQLPDTGGHGTRPFTLTGLLIISAAALIYLALRRGKVRVGK